MIRKQKLLQIGEIAKLYSISRKMILNYEKCGLIKPAYINPSTNYRYFDNDSITIIGQILNLRRVGLSIPVIRKYFLGKTSLNEQISILKNQITEINKAINYLSIQNMEKDTISEIKELIIPKVYCVCKNLIAKNIDEIIDEFSTLFNECYTNDYQYDNKTFNFCEFDTNLLSENFFETENIHTKICISVTGKECNSLTLFEETKALTINYCGKYENSYLAYQKLIDYIINNKIEINGKIREYYIKGGFCNNNDDNIIGIAVPIK